MENGPIAGVEPSNIRATVHSSKNKRALLIGINKYLNPSFNDLDGSINDVQLMFKLLTETFQFPPENVTRLTDDTIEKPTRDGILCSFNRLFAETNRDDIVVVFYAGHGSRRRNSAKANGYNETIVPRDSGRSSHGYYAREQFTTNLDITDDELHELMLRPLASKTSNLVLIVDSCHSGHVLREVQCAKARFVESDESDVFSNAAAAVRTRSESQARSRSLKGSSGWLPVNDRYVLLAACQAHEKANEKHVTFTDAYNAQALTHGAWTYELCRAILAETQTETSTYRSVFERAFPLVTEAFPAQHPTMEGVLNRAVFGMHIVSTMPYVLVVSKTVKQVELSCGAAHGFSLGSQFVICPKGTKMRPSDDDGAVIGTFGISKVGAIRSWACGMGSDVDLEKVEIGSPAFETIHAFDSLKIGVRIIISPTVQQWTAAQEHSTFEFKKLETYCLELAEFITRSAVLFSVEAKDVIQNAITVELSFPDKANQRALSERSIPSYIVYGADGQLEIEEPLAVDSCGTSTLKNKLESLGKYHRVLRLNNSYQQNNPLFNKVELHLSYRSNCYSPWCDIPEDQTSLLPVLFEDQFIGARIVNKGCISVEIVLIELAEDGSVNILYPPNGTSETLEPGNSIFLGHEWGALEVASSLRFQETFKLFVTTEKTDFTVLEQGHFRGDVESSLEELLCTNKMRLIRKRSMKESFWTTVQKSFEIRKKTERSIATATGLAIVFDSREFATLIEPNEMISYENKINERRENDDLVEIISSSYSTPSPGSLYEALFSSFRLENTEDDSVVANFYEQVNQQNRKFSAEILEDAKTFEKFLTTLLQDNTNILPVYRMIHAIWVCDDSAKKNNCQRLQNRMSLTGFSQLVRCMDPTTCSEECAIAHYNIGYILAQNFDILRAKEAILHYEIALDIWDKKTHAVDHGQTLTKIADLHSSLSGLAETPSEKLLHAKTAVALYQTAHSVLDGVSSTEVYLVIFNMAVLLSRIVDIDTSKTFAAETEFTLVLIEKSITALRCQPPTNETAEQLIDMLKLLTTKNGLFQRNLALPWQEDVISICSELISSNVIDDNIRTECNRLLGDAFSSRLVGNRWENLRKAVEHLLAEAEYYSNSPDQNDHGISFAKCVINLGSAVNELKSLYLSPETDVYIEKAKELLMRIVSDTIQSLDENVKVAALYNLSRLVEDNISELLELLPIAAEHAPHVGGRIKGDLALMMLSNCFPEIDEDKESSSLDDDSVSEEVITIHPGTGLSSTRFSELNCIGGAKCCHTQKVFNYLEEADELLQVEKDSDTNYLKNLCVMGRFWATHCTLPTANKMNQAWNSFAKAIEQVERLWPLYNVYAQVSLMNEVGQIFEDALDVAITQYCLQTEQHRVLSVLCCAKSRNLLPTMNLMQSNSNKAMVSMACTTPSSMSLSVFKSASVTSNSNVGDTGLHSDLTQYLREDEVVVEWWMSTKQYAFCIVYSKNEHINMFHMWNRADCASLYAVCLNAQSNQTVHSWDQAFAHRLSQALHLEELHAFLVRNFPAASKLVLVPHVYLYCCQIHALPIFEFKLNCLLDTFPGGISYLPNFKILNILRQPVVQNAQTAPRVLLFQADPNRDLPYSDLEVHKIEATVLASQHTCDVITNTTAEIFRNMLPSTANDSASTAPFFMHVACHGEYNENEPAESYLLFADGEFTMTQFQDISLSSCQLAVLSACNSGLRDFKRSHMTDIFVGFGAQFLAKGCKNVLLTLSPVSDQLTAELMVHFYRGIFDEKKTIASSLRDAQLKLRDNDASDVESNEVTQRLVGKKNSRTKASPGKERRFFAPFALFGAGDYKLH